MQPEDPPNSHAPASSSALEGARRALIARRLPFFAVGWLGGMGVWLIVFALESRFTLAAVVIVALQAALLLAAVLVCRAAPRAPRVLTVTGAACALLAISSTVLFVSINGHGEILTFVLLTLCLAAALLFSWGWRAEMALVTSTLIPWALTFPALAFFVPPLELAAAVTIGSVLSLAIAEGAARSFRSAWLRRASKEEMTRVLAESRDAYRDLAETARDLIWAADLDGRLTYLNDAAARFLGAPPNELIGRSMAEYTTDDPNNPNFTALMARLLAGETVPPVVVQGLTPDGPRWVEGLVSAVHGANGTIIGLRGISRDVTERRIAEEALRASEERFRSAFEDASIGMAVAAPDGHALRVNRAFYDMLGYSEAEMLAMTAQDITHPDDIEATIVAASRVLGGEARSYQLEKRYLHKRGHVVWVGVNSSLVRDANGVPLYFIAQMQDTTERKVGEEALRASLEDLRRSEEKLRLLAQRQVTIREEERTRLGFDLHDDVCQELVGIGILVESLHRKMAPMPAEQGAEFGRIVNYLGEVVEHLRLLARDLRPMLLHDLGLDGSLRALADGMSSAATRVAMDFRTPIPRLGEEAEVTVYRIAQEALANATRHGGARSIVVSLAASDGLLRLEVQDDGCGFDPASPRAEAIGLVSMEERALALGGRLELCSAPGKGTTVRLQCPLVARAPASAA